MIETNEEIFNTREMTSEEKERIKERILASDDRKLKFYEDMRKRIKKWSVTSGGKLGGKLGEYLLLLPDLFILICRLAVDKRVPVKKKVFIGGVITYLILPIDIIPDFIPILGYVDDLVVVVLSLNQILNELDKQIILDNWSGEEDLLVLLQKVTFAAEKFLDKTVLQKIKNIISSKK